MQSACSVLLACVAVPYCSTLSHYSIKKKLDVKYVLFSLQLWSETFLILRKNERGMVIKVCWSSCKAAAIRVRF